MAIHHLLLFVTSLPLLSAQIRDYSGYELLTVSAKTQSDVNVLRNLQSENEKLDFWIEPSTLRNSTVLVPPSVLSTFKDSVKGHGMQYHLLNGDVNRLVRMGSEPSADILAQRNSRASGHIVDHFNYHSYDQILQYLDEFASTYPSQVELLTLNYRTHESRSVRAIRVSSNVQSADTKPSIILEFGIHAREWISPSTALYFIDNVLSSYSMGDPDAELLLENFDWYVVPSTNPDGYEYSRNYDRFWRKNRRNGGWRCTGVDLNRNFNAKFGTTGVSSQCSSDIYPGSGPFSEPETANIRDLVDKLYDSLHVYISIHSFSQFVLVPWGHTAAVSRPPNEEALDRVGMAMADTISSVYNKEYYYGTAYQLLDYAASGASEDWALIHKPGIYAYCYELRPDAWQGINGFAIPASEILPQGVEFFRSIVTMAKMV